MCFSFLISHSLCDITQRLVNWKLAPSRPNFSKDMIYYLFLCSRHSWFLDPSLRLLVCLSYYISLYLLLRLCVLKCLSWASLADIERTAQALTLNGCTDMASLLTFPFNRAGLFSPNHFSDRVYGTIEIKGTKKNQPREMDLCDTGPH